MFLNQVHYARREFGRINGRRAALTLFGPLAILAVLVFPAVLSLGPVANGAELSGTGSRTGPQVHLHDSYTATISIAGQAGCTYQVTLTAPDGSRLDVGESSFPSWATASRQQVSRWNVDLPDGMYAINTTATGCGQWTVSLSRPN
jgi:hypothetical protein